MPDRATTMTDVYIRIPPDEETALPEQKATPLLLGFRLKELLYQLNRQDARKTLPKRYNLRRALNRQNVSAKSAIVESNGGITSIQLGSRSDETLGKKTANALGGHIEERNCSICSGSATCGLERVK